MEYEQTDQVIMTSPQTSYRKVLTAMLLTLLTGAVPEAPAQSEFLAGRMPYAAFDRLPHADIDVPGATLHVGFAPGKLVLSTERVLVWIEHSARLVSAYYGHFPVASVRILIVPVDGSGVRGGATWSYRGAAIRLLVGTESNKDDLNQDWIIVHEMVHLALPDLDESYNWLSEGLATYIEPIARAQAGDLTEASIWAAMVRDMPKGLPHAGDRGLDQTPTWGRTYWGGAMFCLLADIEIRKQSENRFGLQDAMRGVLVAGGNREVDWPIEHVLAVADETTGTHVLTTLHAQMGNSPFAPDLEALWRDLGVIRKPGGAVMLGNAAPLARMRKDITARQP